MSDPDQPNDPVSDDHGAIVDMPTLFARLDEVRAQLDDAYESDPMAVAGLLREIDNVCRQIDELRGFKG